MGTELEDTQPLDLSELPTNTWEPLAWSKEPVSRPAPPQAPPTVIIERAPEPAMIRGLIMAAVGTTTLVAFHNLAHHAVEPYLRLYVGLAPLLLAWWIRGSVTPIGKVKR